MSSDCLVAYENNGLKVRETFFNLNNRKQTDITFFFPIAPTISSSVSFKLWLDIATLRQKQAHSVQEWPESGTTRYVLQSQCFLSVTHGFLLLRTKGLWRKLGLETPEGDVSW